MKTATEVDRHVIYSDVKLTIIFDNLWYWLFQKEPLWSPHFNKRFERYYIVKLRKVGKV